MKEFNSVEEVIEAVRGGKIVVVMDDERLLEPIRR